MESNDERVAVSDPLGMNRNSDISRNPLNAPGTRETMGQGDGAMGRQSEATNYRPVAPLIVLDIFRIERYNAPSL
jgi:hypothetical protein